MAAGAGANQKDKPSYLADKTGGHQGKVGVGDVLALAASLDSHVGA